jgi:catechol 2,3-dioxygenase-like lactoylglutathione lyase family enzyme
MPASATLDHVTVVTDDFEASRAVYDALLAPLGLTATVDHIDPEGDEDDSGTVAALGYAPPGGRPVLWLVAGQVPTTGGHIAFGVDERAAVRQVTAAAAAAGVRTVQAPRDWEAEQLSYYGAQFADPAGNLIEVLHSP